MNNVLGVVLVVIGLAILIFGIWKFYSVYVNQEETNARKFVDSLEGKINALQDKSAADIVFSGFKSDKENKWSLVGWSMTSRERPDKCAFKSCICICPDIAYYPKKDYIDICQTKGFCRVFDQESVYVYKFGSKSGEIPVAVIESAVDLTNIDEWGGLQSVSGGFYTNRIEIPENFIKLDIKKEANKLSVVYSEKWE